MRLSEFLVFFCFLVSCFFFFVSTFSLFVCGFFLVFVFVVFFFLGRLTESKPRLQESMRAVFSSKVHCRKSTANVSPRSGAS